MSGTGEAFREHHRQLSQELERLARPFMEGETAAEPRELAAFLRTELLPHAAGEEQHLYPAVEPLLAAHGMASATMRVDHRFIETYVARIEELAAEFAGAPSDRRASLRRDLARCALELRAVFSVHLAKEEQVYLPLLERYVPEDRLQQILARMHGAEVPASAPADGAVLDVRQVPPPQRHPLILRTFEALTPGRAFTLVNDHDPKPLYYQFQAELTGRFTWKYLEQGPMVWRVRIGRPPAAVPRTVAGSS